MTGNGMTTTEAAQATQAVLGAPEPDLEALARLREPFGPEHVGKLPRSTCRDCQRSPAKVCQQHKKEKCSTCGHYITTRHIDLDYVGHGAVTARLLDVDPTWNWEPLAWDSAGMPSFVYGGEDDKHPVEFWIRLTVGGVTRLGVGTCEPGTDDAPKVLIGDALRNAAMRFGVALDLWIRGHAEDDEAHTATAERTGQGRQTKKAKNGDDQPKPADPEKVANLRARIQALPEEARRVLADRWTQPRDAEAGGGPMLPVANDGRPTTSLLTARNIKSAEALVRSIEVEAEKGRFEAQGGNGADQQQLGPGLDGEPLADQQQQKRLHALLAAKRKPSDDAERHRVLGELVGRQITSAKDLTYSEAAQVIAALDQEPDTKGAQ